MASSRPIYDTNKLLWFLTRYDVWIEVAYTDQVVAQYFLLAAITSNITAKRR